MIVYFTSPDKKYAEMTLQSIKMLRQFCSLPVTVFIIGSGESILDSYPSIQIIKKPPVSSYFCLNRLYMNEIDSPWILHIDSDTFIFDDVEKIISKYKTDFSASIDRWIISQKDWDYNAYNKISSVPVYNGGITLWKNGSHKKWCQDLEYNCRYIESTLPWIYGNNRNGYHKETFSISLTLTKYGFSHSEITEIRNLMTQEDLNSWKEKDFIIFHCFSQNWKRFYLSLKNPNYKGIFIHKYHEHSKRIGREKSNRIY